MNARQRGYAPAPRVSLRTLFAPDESDDEEHIRFDQNDTPPLAVTQVLETKQTEAVYTRIASPPRTCNRTWTR